MFCTSETYLSELRPGDAAVVESLLATGPLRRRLLDLGFVTSTVVKVLRKSPFGDPIAYRVRGAIYAIRTSEARLITVRRLHCHGR